MLLNSDAYWLKGPKREDEWGFMYEGRAERKFATDFPEVWKQISAAELGQVVGAEGMFTFTTVYPLQLAGTSGHAAEPVGDLRHARDAVEERRDQMDSDAGSTWNMEVGISTRNDGDGVLVEVRDNGSGVDQEHLRTLFEPFFTTKDPDRGTGLGLSISYAIVEDHGGEIWCESAPGKDTVFRIRLPVPGCDEPS